MEQKIIDENSDIEDIFLEYQNQNIPDFISGKNLTFSKVANILLNDKTSFFSKGGVATPFAFLSDKDLFADFLEKDFSSYDDITKQYYLQELHNRIAKSLGCPACTVRILENTKMYQNMSDSLKKINGGFMHVTPYHQIFSLKEPVENVIIAIKKEPDELETLLGTKFVPTPVGLGYILTIIHETRHLYQLYASSLLFTKNKKNDNCQNAIAFMDSLANVGKIIFRNFDKVARPDIKNCYVNPQGKNVLINYSLNPIELDARKFTFEYLEKLEKKNLLTKGNWTEYKLKYAFDEYSKLNFYRKQTSEVCPSINFLKKLFINTKLIYKCDDFNDFYKKINSVASEINLNEYLSDVQNYYDKLKNCLKITMLDTANAMRENNISPNDSKKLSTGKLDSLESLALRSSVFAQTFGYLTSGVAPTDELKKNIFQKKSEQKLVKKLIALEKKNPSTNEHDEEIIFIKSEDDDKSV